MRSASVALLIAVLAAPPARAQGFAWENATELSFVSTGGNASSTTFGVKASLTGTGEPNTMKVEIGGIRATSDIKTRRATGTPTSFTVAETSESKPTAASYFARARYDRAFGGAFAFGGAGWDRNTFAGVENRYQFVTGVGRTWVDGESGRLKTDVGATYTIQRDVTPKPGADYEFFGFRGSVEARRRLTAAADYTSTLVVDQNLETTEDFRTDWINSISVAISEGLALKTSLQLLYDAQPANIPVPLFDGGGSQIGTVSARGEEIDRVMTLTLVVRF
jgi:putative salt-induced outer membrane protein YdiY